MFGFLDGLNSAVSAVLGAIAGFAVAVLITVLAYEGVSVTIPFYGPVSIIDGKIDQAEKAAAAKEAAKCDSDNLKAELDTLRKLYDASQEIAAKSALEATERRKRLDAMEMQNADYRRLLAERAAADRAADEEAERKAKADGVRIVYRNRCPPLGRDRADELRQLWGTAGRAGAQ